MTHLTSPVCQSRWRSTISPVRMMFSRSRMVRLSSSNSRWHGWRRIVQCADKVAQPELVSFGTHECSQRSMCCPEEMDIVRHKRVSVDGLAIALSSIFSPQR